MFTEVAEGINSYGVSRHRHGKFISLVQIEFIHFSFYQLWPNALILNQRKPNDFNSFKSPYLHAEYMWQSYLDIAIRTLFFLDTIVSDGQDKLLLSSLALHNGPVFGPAEDLSRIFNHSLSLAGQNSES